MLLAKEFENLFRVSYPNGCPANQKRDLMKFFFAGALVATNDMTSALTRSEHRVKSLALSVEIKQFMETVVRPDARAPDKEEQLTALILKPDGTEIPVVPANFRDFKINELQTICGGFVQVVFLDNDKLLVCNENGMFDGLPENPKASAIYWANGGIPGCPVLGDVLICDKGQIE